jgi:hypothetical protein
LIIEIPKTAFFTTLHEAYKCCNTGEYEQSQCFAWIRGIGEALALGDCDGLGTIINKGGDHWVAVAVDFKESLIWYGDSFRQDAVEDFMSVMD